MTTTVATPPAVHHGSAALTVTGLNKSFTLHAIDRSVTSLTDVNFTVHRGEHLAIAGLSGAGKSSLLRCIYRNYLPDSGQVMLHTTDTDEGSQAAPVDLTALSDRDMARYRGQHIGYVSQFLQAPPRVGPLRLVTDAALRRGHDRATAQALATESLTRLGLDEKLWHVDCSVLSGGERQRVNLAAGTVSPPALLLLDEPVSALDPANRERALGVIEDLRRRNVSVLAIYHDMAIIRRLADRVLLMADGQVRAEGTPEQIVDTLDSEEGLVTR